MFMWYRQPCNIHRKNSRKKPFFSANTKCLWHWKWMWNDDGACKSNEWKRATKIQLSQNYSRERNVLSSLLCPSRSTQFLTVAFYLICNCYYYCYYFVTNNGKFYGFLLLLRLLLGYWIVAGSSCLLLLNSNHNNIENPKSVAIILSFLITTSQAKESERSRKNLLPTASLPAATITKD